ncbi:MAG: tannase/feruloyl esterase family alpha/beta hydrolase [Sphingomonas sp.]|uniref:tannase/feruloyl esterase family alpha/beta hydrolase n=1 Tax=unclassified Sphingomonas TaxID=196159 RepID=UPI00245713D3|nr:MULTISPECIES: tannase/feruloyl esterase family alpha/beta hydrolase [unclassified Sphingomonas]MBQ1498575.1 tannase/feruloyl esterase family alpha/beta hydrolase [Sphingomonas sp.]MDH4746579.1 tannase/feruloyl esterase family alpha/beta hydrolase [Sphingomonas sp. CBMAI 2297]
MNRIAHLGALGAVATALLVSGGAPEPLAATTPSGACTALAGLALADGKVVKAEEVAKGGMVNTKEGTPGLPAQAAFCRVYAVLAPTPRSEIKVEVWLPAPAAWNGKLLGAGNGGYGGSMLLPQLTMQGALGKGYATVGTDMGHVGTADTDAKWALHQPERIVDFGHRANHLASGAGKAVIAAYYGNAPKASYFQGCSDGGREALMEAQRYPEDYDAIVAGAPANAWSRLMTSFMATDRAVFARPETLIPNEKLKLLQDAALAQCDAKDGVKDGVLDDPRQCGFDPAALQCKAGDGPSCLTAGQVTAARSLYRGTFDAKGRKFFPGYMPGAEAVPGAWDLWLTGPKAQHGIFASEFFRNMVYSDPEWQPASFDLARDYAAARRLAPVLDSDNPDIGPFLKRGGKLILYHGWNDAAIAPENTIDYYQAVQKRAGAAAKDSVRLFMVPGMSHCLAGPGPNVLDTLGTIDKWRQGGPAPETMIATKYDNDLFGYLGFPAKPVRTRPLCAYPKVARWTGKGSTDEAANFVCVAPGAKR